MSAPVVLLIRIDGSKKTRYAIGKGMLFYYFNSKEELFYYLLEFGTDFIEKEYLNQIEEQETDFLARYRQAAQCKLKAYTKNPHVFNFLGAVFINKSLELSPEWGERINHLKMLSYDKLFKNIDHSLFRKDIESEKIIKLIQWVMDGYGNEIIARLEEENLASVNMEPYWREFYQYLDILKKIFYKHEGGNGNGSGADR